jgi:hypothetical protein
MNRQLVIALASVALLAGVTASSAALFSPGAPPAEDSLTLPAAQQKAAWNDLDTELPSNAPSSFQPTTSSAVPSTVAVRAIPPKIAADLPALQPYDYAKVGNKLLIVNPHDMMIAEIITG